MKIKYRITMEAEVDHDMSAVLNGAALQSYLTQLIFSTGITVSRVMVSSIAATKQVPKINKKAIRNFTQL